MPVETARPWLDQELARLSPVQRQTVVLHLRTGLTVSEVAQRLGMPEDSIRASLAFALAQLRMALSDQPLDRSNNTWLARSRQLLAPDDAGSPPEPEATQEPPIKAEQVEDPELPGPGDSERARAALEPPALPDDFEPLVVEWGDETAPGLPIGAEQLEDPVLPRPGDSAHVRAAPGPSALPDDFEPLVVVEWGDETAQGLPIGAEQLEDPALPGPGDRAHARAAPGAPALPDDFEPLVVVERGDEATGEPAAETGPDPAPAALLDMDLEAWAAAARGDPGATLRPAAEMIARSPRGVGETVPTPERPAPVSRTGTRQATPDLVLGPDAGSRSDLWRWLPVLLAVMLVAGLAAIGWQAWRPSAEVVEEPPGAPGPALTPARAPLTAPDFLLVEFRQRHPGVLEDLAFYSWLAEQGTEP